MRIITTIAKVDESKCKGCYTCQRVCPVLAISVDENLIAKVDESICVGCGNCYDRCPNYAIKLIPIKEPKTIRVDWTKVNYAQVRDVCRNANLNPKEIICYCTGTRAREVVTSILLGASTPEELSRRTGVRTGCTVECIQPILRLLSAAGVKLDKSPGYQWYGLTPTVLDLPDAVAHNPEYKKFYFEEDRKLLDRVAKAKGSKLECLKRNNAPPFDKGTLKAS